MPTKEQIIPKGYKHTEVGVIPSDWEVKRLRDVGEIITGSTPPTQIKEYWNGLIPWITPTDISNKKDIYNSEREISFLGLQVIRKLPANTLLVTCIASIGKNAILRADGACNQQINAIIPSNDYNVDFLYYLIENSKQYLLGSAGITATLMISKKDFSEITFSIPNNPEQTAIATALSDTDALIEKLTNLIEKKKNIKQGTMQELLTGKRRLPGFSGEWEVKKLGEVVDIKKGQLITDNTRVEGSVPVIAGGKTSAYFHNKANRIGKTITISGSGANAGYVAFHLTPIFASDCSTIEESKKYSIEYIYFFLQLIQECIYKMQTGGAQPHIHPNNLSPIPISLPEKEEQTAIATVLSDIDAEIEKLESQLSKYQNLKQGMMQTLLTGKIRLI